MDARDLTAECSDEIKFVDQGGNFQAIRCPHCSQELTLEWWHDRMDRAFERAFTDLSIVTPCCTELSSLNDLEYDLPAGFARFVLEAESPGCGWLSSVELSQIATDLGHPVRPIWARY